MGRNMNMLVHFHNARMTSKAQPVPPSPARLAVAVVIDPFPDFFGPHHSPSGRVPVRLPGQSLRDLAVQAGIALRAVPSCLVQR
jgi:hypothetical protein